MISPECFTSNWIENKAIESQYKDKTSLKRLSVHLLCLKCFHSQAVHFILKAALA